MGKECSGVGMDPNVIGRARRLGTPEGPNDVIAVDQIGVGELTEASGGNALGVGMADVVTQRLADRMDADVTGLNARTAGFTDGDKVRRVVATDREALEVICAGHAPETIRLAIIQDTAHLARFLVSTALADVAATVDGCTVDDEPKAIVFDELSRIRLA
jgi:hypothetical protein